MNLNSCTFAFPNQFWLFSSAHSPHVGLKLTVKKVDPKLCIKYFRGLICISGNLSFFFFFFPVYFYILDIFILIQNGRKKSPGGNYSDSLVQDQLLLLSEAVEDGAEQIPLWAAGDLSVSCPSLLPEPCWPQPNVGFWWCERCSTGEVPGSSSRPLWGRRSTLTQGWRGSGSRVGWDMCRLGMLKWIFAPRHREGFPSLAQWGRSCPSPEDHGKSSAGSSELISCAACPLLAGAERSTCSDLPVADAVVSMVSHGQAESALEWADASLSSLSSPMGTQEMPVSPGMAQEWLQPSALCLQHPRARAADSWASFVN